MTSADKSGALCEAVAKPIGELHDAERDHGAGFPDRAIELRVSVLNVEYRCAHLRVTKDGVSEKKKGKKEKQCRHQCLVQPQ